MGFLAPLMGAMGSAMGGVAKGVGGVMKGMGGGSKGVQMPQINVQPIGPLGSGLSMGGYNQGNFSIAQNVPGYSAPPAVTPPTDKKGGEAGGKKVSQKDAWMGLLASKMGKGSTPVSMPMISATPTQMSPISMGSGGGGGIDPETLTALLQALTMRGQ